MSLNVLRALATVRKEKHYRIWAKAIGPLCQTCLRDFKPGKPTS